MPWAACFNGFSAQVYMSKKTKRMSAALNALEQVRLENIPVGCSLEFQAEGLALICAMF